MKRYYAEQRPRGFAEEVYTYIFATSEARNEWVSRHSKQSTSNRSKDATAINAVKARRNIAQSHGRPNAGYLNGDIILKQEKAEAAVDIDAMMGRALMSTAV